MRIITVSVDAVAVPDRRVWIREVMSWCDKNEIGVQWMGDSTRAIIDRASNATVSSQHQLDVVIVNPEKRAFFLLRWS